jgi:hypothetical protein
MPRISTTALSSLLLLFVAQPGCIRSVCETKSDCPVGNLCSGGVCIKPCTADIDCPSAKYCDTPSGLCALGCRSSSDCASGAACVQNQCWTVTSPASPADGGSDDGGAAGCSCLRAPRACLKDINPASDSAGSLVCEPGASPYTAALFFGNVGCSHCQHIFGDLLRIQAQLHDEGLTPTLVFVQLASFTPSGNEVASTFPSHTGPVLQDTDSEDMWHTYGADWYQVKIIDSYGCLSAFFTSPDTLNLVSGGQLQATGKLLKDAWRSATTAECHAMNDAGTADGAIEVGR